MARPGTSLRLLVATAVLSLLPLSGLWLWKGQGPLGAPATVLVEDLEYKHQQTLPIEEPSQQNGN